MPNIKLVHPYTAIAFDYGLKKIGVAIGESLTNTAKPLCIIHSKSNQINYEAIEKLIREWRPAVIVVGIPHNPLDNDTSNQKDINYSSKVIVNKAQKFANILNAKFSKKYSLCIETTDEVNTSIEAKNIFTTLRKNKQIKQGQKIDDIAACLILERWFQDIS